MAHPLKSNQALKVQMREHSIYCLLMGSGPLLAFGTTGIMSLRGGKGAISANPNPAVTAPNFAESTPSHMGE
jgi:hypothetical protein